MDGLMHESNRDCMSNETRASDHAPAGPRIGDVVRLKSGGPGMTVSDIRADGAINVEWFNGDALCSDAFRVECLTPGGTLMQAGPNGYVSYWKLAFDEKYDVWPGA